MTPSWIRKLFAGLHATRPKNKKRPSNSYLYRPWIEKLEDRTLPSTLTFTAPAGTNSFRLVESSSTLELFNNGSQVDSAASPTAVVINGGGPTADNSLAIDYSGGNFSGIPITFDGGGGTGTHNVTVENATLTSLTYDATGTNAGDLVVNGNPQITFTDVQTVTDTDTVGTVTINVDPNNAISGQVNATFTNAGASTDSDVSGFVNGGTLPSVSSFTFGNPTVALVVNGHLAANDFAINSLGTGFNAALTVNAGSVAGDTVGLNTSVALGSATSSGNLQITATTIDLNTSSITTDNGGANGSVTMTGAVTIGYRLGELVPAYFDPTSDAPDWASLDTAALTTPVMAIMNPDSGPGTSREAEYTDAIGALQANGGQVIGYVPTDDGQDSMSTVKTEIDDYLNWYPAINGIFLDQMTNGTESGSAVNLAYYQTLYQYIKGLQANWIVVGNPGSNTIEAYAQLPVADILVEYENDTTMFSYNPYTPPSFQAGFPASQFASLVYNVSTVGAMQTDVDLTASTYNTGWVYVTNLGATVDDVMGNPYGSLPTIAGYFSAFTAAVADALSPTTLTIGTGTGGISFSSSVLLDDPTTLDTGALTAAAMSLNGFDLIVNDTGAAAITGVISGTGSTLTKQGAGTLTLSSAGDTYTGATTVSAGTLLVNGSTAAGSAVAVNGGTLGGTGTIGGAVTVNTGGTINPGTVGAVGTLTVGSLSFNGGTYQADLDPAASTADQIATAGAVNLANSSQGVFSFNVLDGTLPTAGTQFILIENTSGGAITNPPFTNAAQGGTAPINGMPGTYTYTGNPGLRSFVLVVDLATPTLTTTPSPTTVPLGASSVTLNDTADLTGGDSPTGTITFTLYLGTSLVSTETVAVSGNGNYTTPGYTLPTSGTVTGTYQWDASYGGDSNDTPATDLGASNEQVVVSAASPTITTTPNPTAVTLGTTSVTLKDTADLTGAYNPTGTITFTLFQGSTLVNTETVAVSGTGNYTTPGYTLPTSGTVTGTYQWDASYAASVNNNSASDNGAANEQVVVSAASPTITTTPNPTAVTLGTASVTLKDTADLTGAYNPTGTITFTLFQGSTLVNTETVAVSGTGNYTTPGYTLPTSGTVTGTYQWDASYAASVNNNSASDNGAANEQVVVSAANPTITTTPNPTAVTLGTTSVALDDTADLTGAYNPTGTITFTLFQGSTLVNTETVAVSGNGNYTTPGYTLPASGTVTGTYQWDASYSASVNNNSATDNGAANEQVVASAANPAITTTPNPTAVTLGTTSVTLKDTADLTGAYNPTGTITFTLYLGTSLVNTQTVAVSGGGNYTTPGYTLPTSGTVTGTYQWDASYGGDGNNSTASDNGNTNEQLVVSPASTTITTTPSVTTVALGASAVTLKDTADLTGAYNPTGTITFTLYLGTSLVNTETVAVSGDGNYTTPGYTLPTSGTVTGTYQWDASYAASVNNNSASDNGAANEQVVVSAANPTITTTPNPTAVTLGTTSVALNDTADLTGAYNPTGTITFTLFQGSTLVNTETVAVSGTGNYTTPGYTLPTSGTVTGTYQWDASYAASVNNNSASDNGAANEQVVVSAASPTITTTPNPTAVTLGTTSVALNDTADLTGAYNPTGTITFTLFQGSTLVNTETVAVSGTGNYTTPGYTLPTSGTVTGTYQWDASYAASVNNNSASDNGAANEQVVVSAASPTITTTPNPTAVTLGTTSVTLNDTADLTGAYNPTGTITFTLFQGTALVSTETVAVSGNGNYTAPGYTLPTSGTVTGTFQWDASYAASVNNNSASDNGAANEQVVVSAASPTITTTPNPTVVTLGTTSVTLKDTADLTGAYNPTGTITFTLFQGSTLVSTETVAVSGNGNYTTPGYTLPASGTVTGTYQWDASYAASVNNNSGSDNSAANEQVVVSAANPTITTTPNPTAVTLGTASVTLNDTADLTGAYNPTGTITFTLFQGTTQVNTETVAVSGNGNYTTPGYTLPTSGTVTGTYQWDASYAASVNNNSASDNGAANEQVVVGAASPSITTTPSVTTVALGASAVTLKDTADLTGAYNPTGTITFTLFQGTTLVSTETVAVSGNGNYTTPGYTLPTSGTVTGTYQWDASYAASVNNNSATDNGVANEQVVVSAASPTITTTPNPSTVTVGTSAVTLNDTADLTGGYDPTGTITFTLYQGTTLLNTETVAVSGDGNYTTPTGYTLTPSTAGTYQWDASYTGDGNNNSFTDINTSGEQVVVSVVLVTPTLTTSPSATAVTLGTASVTLNDTADLTGGDGPTGTITFTLFQGTTLVNTETVAVSGDGNYTTPGYTLPTSGTVTGTYQWDASYGGDGNNTTVSDNGASNEQVVVSAANPTITTTPNPTTVTLGTSAVTLNDAADLTGAYNPTGTITFTLFHGSTLVNTETVAVSGNGNYTTPGYTLPASGTVTGAYQWDASYSASVNNNSATDNGAANEQVVASAANPTITTTPNPTAVTLGTTSVTLKDTADLTGAYNPTGTITFTLYLGTSLVNTQTVAVSGGGNYTTPGYTLPTSGTVTGTYQWDASYGGDGNNSTASDNGNTNEQLVVSPASTTITTTPSVTTVALGASAVTLKDTADLTGAYNPTGTITFTLYLGTSLVNTETVAVSGDGNYTTPGYTLPTSGTVTGTYQWDASYGGDGNNGTASDNGAGNEQVVVSGANPTITTTPSATTLALGASAVTLKDTADLTGAYNPSGTITFTLYQGSTLVNTETVAVSGNGNYTTPGYTLPTSGTVTGTYQWDASYGSAANNNAASDINNSNEQVVVSAASPTITTTPNPTAVTLGTSPVTLTDTANLTGGYNPTGTITFTLFQGSTLVNTETVAISGNGNYTTPGYTLPTSGTVTGTYQWDASYSGAANNSTASDVNASNEQVVVSAASSAPEVFIIGTNQEIYYQLFNASGTATTGFMQSAPGFAIALAAGDDTTGPELFVIGTNQEIYAQQLNANGTPMTGASFQQTAPGFALALAVGSDSIGPELFVIGTNKEIYSQQLNANGTPMTGASFQQTAPGFALALAVGQDTTGPELFVIGTNQEIYSQQLNANGTPMTGASFQQTAPGFALALAVGQDTTGPELFVIGTNQEIYSQQLNANGTPMTGASFQQTAPGFALALAVGTDSIGPELFVIGTNQEIYSQQLNPDGTPMSNASFQQTAPGFALAIAVTDPVVEATAQALAQNVTPADLGAFFASEPLANG